MKGQVLKIDLIDESVEIGKNTGAGAAGDFIGSVRIPLRALNVAAAASG